MDTVVQIQVFTETSKDEAEAKINRAFEAFQKIERACSRFNPDSELMRACRQIQRPVQVSPFLFEPLKFALEIAKWTDGIFDPTVGKAMEEQGFNRQYLTGKFMESPASVSATYRDIVLNERDRTVYLRKPMVIDLGAVAKGFAIDLAVNELKDLERFCVNAGGDLFAGGAEPGAGVWKIGIRHPTQNDRIIHTVEISNEAICTSGGYERKSPKRKGVHHLILPHTKQSPNDWISCSVIAPFAMLADAFSTAVFLSGVERGKSLIEEAELKGILITSGLQIMKVGGI